MASYEPEKIIQLLQLCSWKERTEMSLKGLIDLAARVGRSPEKGRRSGHDVTEPNDRYFVDLLSEARKAQKGGVNLPKRERFIEMLLNHVDFSHWEEWKDALRMPEKFIDPEGSSPQVVYEHELTLILPKAAGKELQMILPQVRKSVSFNETPYAEETLGQLVQLVLAEQEKSAVVICLLPAAWKEQAVKIRKPSWGDFTACKRILPVWMDAEKEWGQGAPFIPALKQEQVHGGIAGLLIGLLFLQQQREAVDSGNAAKAGKSSRPADAPSFNHSSVGFYMQGGTVHHLNTGGDQTINNYFD